MTVSQRLMKTGRFSIAFETNMPQRLINTINELGHIFILPAHINDCESLSDSAMKGAAKYVGVVRKHSVFSVEGSDVSFWLGDEDGVGPIYETAISQTSANLSTWLSALLPAGSPVLPGTVTSPGGTLTWSAQYMTPRQAIDYVCNYLGAEWRIKNDATIDAAVPGTLFPGYTTPKAVAVAKDGSYEYAIMGLDASLLTNDHSAEEITTKVLVVSQGDGGAATIGTATIGSNPYKDLRGQAVNFKRMVDGTSITPGNASTVATNVLNLFQSVRTEIGLSTSDYALTRFVIPGDNLYVFDPIKELYDTANQIQYRGRTIMPVKVRVRAITWPIEHGYGVYFRDKDGVYTDLTDWVKWETGDTFLELGPPSRGLDSSAEQEVDTVITGITGVNQDVLERLQRGLWVDYTPVLTASVTNPTLGSGATQQGRYCRIGNFVACQGRIVFGTGMTAGSGVYRIQLPVDANNSAIGARRLGTASVYDSSAGQLAAPINLTLAATTYVVGEYGAAWPIGGLTQIGAAAPIAWAQGDELQWTMMYEAA